jgi:hypothetical protein
MAAAVSGGDDISKGIFHGEQPRLRLAMKKKIPYLAGALAKPCTEPTGAEESACAELSLHVSPAGGPQGWVPPPWYQALPCSCYSIFRCSISAVSSAGRVKHSAPLEAE